MLLDVGRVAQAVLDLAASSGLGAWMTPAIKETEVALLLQLSGPEVDPVYFLRISKSDEKAWDYEK